MKKLPDHAVNLLTLHNYMWKWVEDGKSFAIWRVGDNAFIMSGDETVQEWLDIVAWYEGRPGAPDGSVSTRLSPYSQNIKRRWQP